MIAGLLHQIMQSSAFASQHQDTIAPEVIFGIVRRSALIQSKHPDMLLLHLLQRANQVRDTSDPHMLRRSRRCLGNRRRNRSRTPLRQNDAMDASAISSPQQRPQIVRVLNPVKRQEEPVFSLSLRSQQVFYPQELTLPNDRQHPLMSVRPSQSGQ